MRLTIVYDNKINKRKSGLQSDWGFACLIETKIETILFDTGAKKDILLNNMKKLDLNSSEINKIVISHEHWDHNGGLESMTSFIDEVEVYRLAEKPRGNRNTKYTKVLSAMKITDGIYTTGKLRGSPVDEQSLVLKGKKGWYVLVGCSHPGVEIILNEARKIGTIVGIIGGLHGFDQFSILRDLDFICPCHCTKHGKEIKKIYGDRYHRCGVGKIINLN
jgi:7,8-dihydropterin-6-yl-methyl-4-(beta-D-ribofuranosyl)aminobenzene 5'-phosphate synthase